MATEAKTKKTTSKKTTPKKSTSTKKTSQKSTTKRTANVKKPAPKKAVETKQVKVLQEENNYKSTVIAAIIIALIILVGIFTIQHFSNKNDEPLYVATEDEAKFKKEYESLNGTTDIKVEIIKNNNIVYISMKEAAEILDSGSGVIYFGYSACATCRSAVPILLKAMSSSELNRIYYVDLIPNNKEENDIRDLYTLNEKNKAKVLREATPEYDSVRTALANQLSDYILTTSNGKNVNTGQKRLNDLTVVSVVEGQIMGYHEGTVEGHEIIDGKLSALTKEQEKELLTEYTKVISSQLNKKCTLEDGC